jgi:hypothetical protein
MAIRKPLKKPYFNSACFEYSEHVGWYRQELGKNGDIIPWYMRIKPKKINFNNVPNFFSRIVLLPFICQLKEAKI